LCPYRLRKNSVNISYWSLPAIEPEKYERQYVRKMHYIQSRKGQFENTALYNKD